MAKQAEKTFPCMGNINLKNVIFCTLEDQDGTMSGGSCSQRENVTNCHHYPSVPLREDIAKFFILYHFCISYLYHLCFLYQCDKVITTMYLKQYQSSNTTFNQMMERDGLYVAKTKIVIFHVKICQEVFSSFY